MKYYPPASELKTIVECLQMIADLTTEIETIEQQLDFPRDSKPGWRERAKYALRTLERFRLSANAHLAVLQQLKKEHEVELMQRRNNYLVPELAKYVPDVVFRACEHRAKLRAG
jgi:hypothetical protein